MSLRCAVLFDIDWQGTRRLTSKARDDIVSVFILPPSMKELARRLKARGQEELTKRPPFYVFAYKAKQVG